MDNKEAARAKFLGMVTTDAATGCHIFGGVRPGLYGSFWFEGRSMPAHRAAVELFVGPIPPRRTVHHICENARCVNTEHLQVLTLAEHVRVHRNGPAVLQHSLLQEQRRVRFRTDLGLRITAARCKAGLSQLQLSELVGRNMQTIQKWEQGHKSTPTAADLLEICVACGVPIGELVSIPKTLKPGRPEIRTHRANHLKWRDETEVA